MDRRQFLATPLLLAGCGMDVELQQVPQLRTSPDVFSLGVTREWTPAFTFLTPGDLSVTYARRFGYSVRIGDLVFLYFALETTSGGFTHSTATGNLLITNIPYEVRAGSNYALSKGSCDWQGITRAGVADITPLVFRPNAGSTEIGFFASASGASIAAISTTDVPTGGTLRFEGGVDYIAESFT